MRIKAVIFDFDGVLIDTEHLWYLCFKEILGKQNIIFTKEFFYTCVGTKNQNILKYLASKDLSEDMIKSLINDVIRLFNEKKITLKMNYDLKETIKYLFESKIQIAVATCSEKREVLNYLKKNNVYQYFDFVKALEDVDLIKPDPEIYNLCLKEMNVLGHEVLVLEDSLYGLQAAHKAKCQHVLVKNELNSFYYDGYSENKISNITKVNITKLININ